MIKIIKVNWLGRRTIALAFFPFIFVNKNKVLSERNIRHELIHHQQQKEMLLVFFYVWYVLEYLFRIVQHKFYMNEAYNAISFEKEAYQNEMNINYMKSRKCFAWIKYFKK